MVEEVNNIASDNNSNSENFGENKVRSNYVQIIITFSLIFGPIILPFLLIWPNWFSSIPFLLEISVSITLLFIISSGIAAYLREKVNK